LGLLKKSGTIFLKNNDIDTIIPIDLNETMHQFSSITLRTKHLLNN
jgi:hypothetical protein